MSEPRDRDSVADGPVEAFPFPDRLRAHVVRPGDLPRIHGFDVQGDLALRYSAAELQLIVWTGEAPDEECGRAFEVAVAFLAPVTVAEAPAHAGVLARLCGATTSATIATIALTLAEQARVAVEEYRSWLEDGNGDRSARGASGAQAEALDRLAAALPARFRDCAPGAPSLEIGCLSVLARCGLTRPAQLEAALVWARLPCAVAEALAVGPGAFRDYPMDVPKFRYEGGR